MTSKSMHLLRKYQKTVLVVMGVILMVTFTVGGSLSMLSDRGGSGAYEDPVAVTWTKGAIREGDFQLQRSRHVAAKNFLIEVINETLQRGGRPVVNGQPITELQAIQQIGIGIPMDDSDPMLLQIMILAEEGRRMGIVVDQAAVKQHLKALSSPELSEAEWSELLNKVISNTRLSQQDVLDYLAFVLRSEHARLLASAGLGSVPPGKMWECFNRLNRRATIEAFPVDVAPLVANVKGEPTAAEIEKIFQDGRFNDPNPGSHEPGFHKPHKVAFEYVRVDFAPFLEEAKKKITDEEIKKKYDLDISQGLHKELALPAATPPGEAPKLPEATPPGDAKPGEIKPGEAKPGEAKPEENKPATPPAEPKPGEAKPADAKPDAAKPADPKPEAKSEEKPAAKAADPAPECVQETTPAAKAPEQPAAQDKPATDKPATDKPATDKPATDKPETDKPTTDKPATEPSATDKPAETPPAAPKPPEQKFKTLDEVKDKLREELARPLAQDASTKAVDEVIKSINAYGNQYRRFVTKKEAMKGKVDVSKSDPGKFDLAAATAKYNFVAGKTELVDRFEIAGTELGAKARSFDRQSFQMVPFANFAFGYDVPLYTVDTALSADMESDAKYYFYRTAEEAGGEVKLADVKDQIVAAWKRKKAFELALEDAKQLAAKVQPPKTLRDIVADPAKIATPAPFAWLTADSLAFGFSMPKPTEVAGIDQPGREFMQAVFSLQPGETGVAPNEAHSRVYVVRVIAFEPKEELLRTQFMESSTNNFQVRMIAMQDAQMTYTDWFREIEDRYQVKWQRPPVSQHRGSEM